MLQGRKARELTNSDNGLYSHTTQHGVFDGDRRVSKASGCCCCWLLNVPTTCSCISETDLLNCTYLDKSCRANFLRHPVTVYRHHASLSQRDPRMSVAFQGSHWSTSFSVTGITRPGKRSTSKVAIEPRSNSHEAGALPLGQREDQMQGVGQQGRREGL